MFWTIDQIADMLALPEQTLRNSYIWYEGRDKGAYRRQYLRAVNVNVGRHDFDLTNNAQREWRVAEDEFLRWLTYHKLWILEPDKVKPEKVLLSPSLTFNEHNATVVDLIIPSTEEPHD